MSKGYVIHVGQYAPEKVIVAFADRDRKPIENTIIETFKKNGGYLLINRARVYARRVLDDGSTANDVNGKPQVLEVTDIRYHGKLEFLPWGTQKIGAQSIEVRYLNQSHTLDVEYQDYIQKIRLDPEGKDGSAFLELMAGENQFNEKTEVLKIQMFKVHPQNRDSISKNPDPSIKGYVYHEVTDEQTDKAFVKAKEASLTAGLFVKDISTKPEQLKNLFEIFSKYGVRFGDVNDLSNETDIYSALLRFADQPGDFGSHVQRYKSELYECFEKAKSYKALDLTKNGFIAMTIENKPYMVWEGAEGKKDEMIEWVLANFVDDYVYKQSQYFKSLCEKLK